MILSRETLLVYLISGGLMTNENYRAKSSEFLEVVRVAADVRIPLVQVREKNISARRVFELTESAVALTSGSRTAVLVNDRIDIAIAAGAAGVHLPSRSIPVEFVRRNVPRSFLVGVSTHTIEEIAYATNAGADFAVFGPVFETPGKEKPVGIDMLRLACSGRSDFPVLALGGVTETNYRDVIHAGAAGFAAIRFLNNADNLEKLSQQLEL